MEFLFDATAGAVDVTVATESETGARAACLEEDRGDQENGENNLGNGEDHIAHQLTRASVIRKVQCVTIDRAMGDDVELLQSESVEPSTSSERTKMRLVTAIFAIVLFGVAAFFWRVFVYYRSIGDGSSPQTITYKSSAITRAGEAVRSLADAGTGTHDLVTNDDPSIGNLEAAVTIVEFADFGCNYSEEASYVVRAIARQFPDTVRVIYRDFPLTDINPGADLVAQAGECAQDQDLFWEFHDTVFAGDVELTAEAMFDVASVIGANEEQFANCLASGRYADEVEEDLLAGVQAGVTGTPTFFFNGVKVEGSIPFTVFNDIVHALLKD